MILTKTILKGGGGVGGFSKNFEIFVDLFFRSTKKNLKKQVKNVWKILTKRFFGFWKILTAVFSARALPSKLIYIGSKNGYLKIVHKGGPLGRQGVKFLKERNPLPPPLNPLVKITFKKVSQNFTFHYRGKP